MEPGKKICDPFSSISGVPAYPGWVVASTFAELLISGSGVAGLIVCTPAPGILKAIVLVPGVLSESRIAWRNEPAPVSLTLITVKVASNCAALEGLDAKAGRPASRLSAWRR